MVLVIRANICAFASSPPHNFLTHSILSHLHFLRSLVFCSPLSFASHRNRSLLTSRLRLRLRLRPIASHSIPLQRVSLVLSSRLVSSRGTLEPNARLKSLCSAGETRHCCSCALHRTAPHRSAAHEHLGASLLIASPRPERVHRPSASFESASAFGTLAPRTSAGRASRLID